MQTARGHRGDTGVQAAVSGGHDIPSAVRGSRSAWVGRSRLPPRYTNLDQMQPHQNLPAAQPRGPLQAGPLSASDLGTWPGLRDLLPATCPSLTSIWKSTACLQTNLGSSRTGKTRRDGPARVSGADGAADGPRRPRALWLPCLRLAVQHPLLSSQVWLTRPSEEKPSLTPKPEAHTALPAPAAATTPGRPGVRCLSPWDREPPDGAQTAPCTGRPAAHPRPLFSYQVVSAPRWEAGRVPLWCPGGQGPGAGWVTVVTGHTPQGFEP